ncbi:hypothetical protein IFM89_005509 [Coptis chinensis]|uniref:Pectinesterase n=1 Tax=Coptis chinensis TaxID=261450 RepID=A0A835M715_9MAGN|nr:hypothetical protein IFM89_005509 [Coptis chinensis]
MASKHFSFIYIIPFLVIVILLFSSPSHSAYYTSSAPFRASAICNSTVDHYFCRSTLPQNVSWNQYDYSHYSFQQSLSTTRVLSFWMTKYLRRQWKLPISAIRALDDCKKLADLNTDFLSKTMATLDSLKSSLSGLQAEDLQALFSAILTNQQTCLDGLQFTSSAWNATSDIHSHLSNGKKMHSLSLALFTNAWFKQIKSGRQANEEWRNKWEGLARRRRIIHANLKGVVVNNSVVVNPNGSGDFTTITDAINAAPNNTDISNGYFVIFIAAGVYEEYVNVAKNKMNLMMIGDGINKTVITGNRSVGDGWTTFNSATFIVVGQGFVGVDMTIQNAAGAIKGQAVALRSGADMSTFYRCSFEGYQDTLYTHSLRQFYRECDIYGTVDFIFGNAAVVLQNCNIYPRLPIHGQSNEITAQGRTDPNQNTGISIHNCNIRASKELGGSTDGTMTYLGRPWKEYSRTVYMQSFMDSVIAPIGWDKWSGDFALSTLYYTEFNNTGPGSDTSNRVTWPGYQVINTTDAASFTVSNFIAGDAWLPQTGVPYTAGLI